MSQLGVTLETRILVTCFKTRLAEFEDLSAYKNKKEALLHSRYWGSYYYSCQEQL